MLKRAALFMPIVLIFVAATPGSARTARTNLDAAARDYDRAQVTGDGQLLEELLDDDYVLINSSGEAENKRQFIKDLTDPEYHLEPYAVRHAIERRWANGAVLGGVARLAGRASGKPFDVCLRFADVWALRHGAWRVVYTQAAHAPAEDCK